MFEDFVKASQDCLINIKVIHAFEITLHVTQKLFIDQFTDFIISKFLHCSAMQGKHSKIIMDLIPVHKVGTNGH